MELRLEGIEKSFSKKRVLRGIDLTLEGGDVFLLLGPNASGKSTLLKIIATVLKPDRGKIFLDGVDVTERPGDYRRVISYVPEVPSLIEELDVISNLRFFSRLFGVNVDLEVLLEDFGLSGESKKIVSKLSKGMRQRLSLAVATMRDPDILILDEPTSGLDSETTNVVLEMVENFASEERIVVVTSHDESDLLRVATRIGILENGKLILDEYLEEIEPKRLVEVEIGGERRLFRISEVPPGSKVLRVLGLRESMGLQET